MGKADTLKALDSSAVLVLDTETTGIRRNGDDEVLSLAIMSLDGNVLFYDTFKPERRKRWPKAEEVNGISPSMVKDKQPIAERCDEIEAVLRKASLLVGYNLEFDIEFLQVSGIKIPKCKKFDVMREFAKIHGEWNERFEEWSWCKLEDCAYYYDYEFDAHDALEDVRATAHCYQAVINDFLFGEPRRKPRKKSDEFGEYLDYGDEEIRTIVYSGYAKEMKRQQLAAEQATEKASEPVEETPAPTEAHAVASAPKTDAEPRKGNPALVVIGILCALIGAFIAVSGGAVAGVPLLIVGILLAVGAKGKK